MSESFPEEKFLQTLVITIGIVVILVITIVNYQIHITKKNAFENGYSQQVLMGRAGIYWVKDDKVLD